MAGDAARGIQSRVMFPEHGAVVDPQLTVSMNDESLFGYINADNSTPLPARDARLVHERPAVRS